MIGEDFPRGGFVRLELLDGVFPDEGANFKNFGQGTVSPGSHFHVKAGEGVVP